MEKKIYERQISKQGMSGEFEEYFIPKSIEASIDVLQGPMYESVGRWAYIACEREEICFRFLKSMKNASFAQTI